MYAHAPSHVVDCRPCVEPLSAAQVSVPPVSFLLQTRTVLQDSARKPAFCCEIAGPSTDHESTGCRCQRLLRLQPIKLHQVTLQSADLSTPFTKTMLRCRYVRGYADVLQLTFTAVTSVGALMQLCSQECFGSHLSQLVKSICKVRSSDLLAFQNVRFWTWVNNAERLPVQKTAIASNLMHA